jgi:hypothetical protein
VRAGAIAVLLGLGFAPAAIPAASSDCSPGVAMTRVCDAGAIEDLAPLPGRPFLLGRVNTT